MVINKRYKQKFLEYNVSNISMTEMLDEIKIVSSREFDVLRQIFVINANKIYQMDRNPLLKEIGNSADYIISEMAIILASKWLKKPLKERVSGVELMGEILSLSAAPNLKVYFLGATEEVNNLLFERCKKKYRNVSVVGRTNGFFQNEESVLKDINNSKPDVLFVALGSPRQEIWINKNREQIKAKFAIGVGGSFDVYAGIKKPAPKWTKHGFEWIYRTLQDPKVYLKRYLFVNSYFMFKLLRFVVLDKLIKGKS